MALQRLIFTKITLERQSRQRERKAPTAESKRVIKRMLQLYLTAVLRRNRRRSHAPPRLAWPSLAMPRWAASCARFAVPVPICWRAGPKRNRKLGLSARIVGTPSSRTEPGISPTGRLCGFISIAGLLPTRPLEIKRADGILGATVREPRLGAWGVWTSRRGPSFFEKLTPHRVKSRNAAGAIRSIIGALHSGGYMVRKIVYWTSTVIVAVSCPHLVV
jgi:hypothetical protein